MHKKDGRRTDKPIDGMQMEAPPTFLHRLPHIQSSYGNQNFPDSEGAREWKVEIFEANKIKKREQRKLIKQEG